MNRVEEQLASAFVCPLCEYHGAKVERLAMSGTGMSRFFDIQRHRYAFVSCTNCGNTQVYDLRVLEGKDDLGQVLEILFGG